MDEPDPDKMYALSDAAPYTSSPLVEVFDHNVNVLHRRIARRQEISVARLNALQQATQEVSGTPVTPTTIPTATPTCYAETVTATPTNTTCPIPPLPRYELRTCSQLNATLERRDFARRVNRQPGDWQLDPPPCVQRSCPFCRGPLLLQRFSLLQRLYQLNVLLYGHIEATAYLQKH